MMRTVSSVDWRLDVNGLKTALESPVLFDVLPVFIERRGADALNFAARQSGLQHIRGIDRSLGCPGSDKGMQFVDENNDIPGLNDFLHHDFEALFELSAVFCSGHEGSKIKSNDPSRQKIVRNL